MQGRMGSEQFNVKLLEIGSAESKKRRNFWLHNQENQDTKTNLIR